MSKGKQSYQRSKSNSGRHRNDRRERPRLLFRLRTIGFIFLGGCLFFCILSFYNEWGRGGVTKLETALKNVPGHFLQKMGLSLAKVYVEGREKTSKQEILKALHLQQGDYIFKVNLQECYNNLTKLRWVRSVMIERRLPSTLYIRLVEKKPIAFWQHERKVYLIDTFGNIIDESVRQQFPHFIVVTGEKAPKALPSFLTILNHYSILRQQTSGAIYVGQRRWDLLFKNGICINLPEENIENSCKLLEKLFKEGRLDRPNIKSVDLRGSDRIYFYLKETSQKKDKKEEKNA